LIIIAKIFIKKANNRAQFNKLLNRKVRIVTYVDSLFDRQILIDIVSLS